MKRTTSVSSEYTCELTPFVEGVLLGGLGICTGISKTAGTYVVSVKHFEHCLLNAGRCLEALHLKAKHNSPAISEHNDWCGVERDR